MYNREENPVPVRRRRISFYTTRNSATSAFSAVRNIGYALYGLTDDEIAIV
jgi:hypothetical protein